MNEKIIVAYATKYGASAEIAQKIGEVLTNSGWDTDVLPTDRVHDLDQYKAIVLGSAVYIGNWRKKPAKFLKTNEKILIGRPVWLFSSGPTGEGEPVELLKGWRIPAGLQPIIDRIRPRDIVVFHGSIYVNKLDFLEKWMLNNVKSPTGSFPDWNAITTWATSINDALR